MKEAFDGLIRNRLMSVASIITVTACIFLLTCTYIVANNLNYIMNQIRMDGIQIFLDDDMTRDELHALSDDLNLHPLVENAVFISSQEAEESFFSIFDDWERISELFQDEYILPRSFMLRVTRDAYRKGIVQDLYDMREDHPGISRISDGSTLVSTLSLINNIITGVLVVIFLNFCVQSIIIIFNTIKMTVHNRKNEIHIMKYIGATNGFIRMPFLIEGVVIGLIGSLIPILLSWLLYNNIIIMLYDRYPTIFPHVVELSTDTMIFPFLMPLTCVLGVTLGVMGSITSVLKYLKV
jgi:cell division transport system permease protein